jgi:hypothetical protein
MAENAFDASTPNPDDPPHPFTLVIDISAAQGCRQNKMSARKKDPGPFRPASYISTP